MAQRTTVMLIDDLDGGEAEETVGFGLDGAAYEIDLSGRHATALRDELGSYIARARRTGRAQRPTASRGRIEAAAPSAAQAQAQAEAPTPAPQPPTPAPAPATRPTDADAASKVGPDGLTGDVRERIRSWAQDEGIEVKARGRLTKDLIANYRVVQSRR